MDSWQPGATVGLVDGYRWYRRLRCGQVYYKAFLEVVPSADPVLVESLTRKDRFPTGPSPFQLLLVALW